MGEWKLKGKKKGSLVHLEGLLDRETDKIKELNEIIESNGIRSDINQKQSEMNTEFGSEMRRLDGNLDVIFNLFLKFSQMTMIYDVSKMSPNSDGSPHRLFDDTLPIATLLFIHSVLNHPLVPHDFKSLLGTVPIFHTPQFIPREQDFETRSDDGNQEEVENESIADLSDFPVQDAPTAGSSETKSALLLSVNGLRPLPPPNPNNIILYLTPADRNAMMAISVLSIPYRMQMTFTTRHNVQSIIKYLSVRWNIPQSITFRFTRPDDSIAKKREIEQMKREYDQNRQKELAEQTQRESDSSLSKYRTIINRSRTDINTRQHQNSSSQNPPSKSAIRLKQKEPRKTETETETHEEDINLSVGMEETELTAYEAFNILQNTRRASELRLQFQFVPTNPQTNPQAVEKMIDEFTQKKKEENEKRYGFRIYREDDIPDQYLTPEQREEKRIRIEQERKARNRNKLFMKPFGSNREEPMTEEERLNRIKELYADQTTDEPTPLKKSAKPTNRPKADLTDVVWMDDLLESTQSTLKSRQAERMGLLKKKDPSETQPLPVVSTTEISHPKKEDERKKRDDEEVTPEEQIEEEKDDEVDLLIKQAIEEFTPDELGKTHISFALPFNEQRFDQLSQIILSSMTQSSLLTASQSSLGLRCWDYLAFSESSLNLMDRLSTSPPVRLVCTRPPFEYDCRLVDLIIDFLKGSILVKEVDIDGSMNSSHHEVHSPMRNFGFTLACQILCSIISQTSAFNTMYVNLFAKQKEAAKDRIVECRMKWEKEKVGSIDDALETKLGIRNGSRWEDVLEELYPTISPITPSKLSWWHSTQLKQIYSQITTSILNTLGQQGSSDLSLFGLKDDDIVTVSSSLVHPLKRMKGVSLLHKLENVIITQSRPSPLIPFFVDLLHSSSKEGSSFLLTRNNPTAYSPDVLIMFEMFFSIHTMFDGVPPKIPPRLPTTSLNHSLVGTPLSSTIQVDELMNTLGIILPFEETRVASNLQISGQTGIQGRLWHNEMEKMVVNLTNMNSIAGTLYRITYINDNYEELLNEQEKQILSSRIASKNVWEEEHKAAVSDIMSQFGIEETGDIIEGRAFLSQPHRILEVTRRGGRLVKKIIPLKHGQMKPTLPPPSRRETRAVRFQLQRKDLPTFPDYLNVDRLPSSSPHSYHFSGPELPETILVDYDDLYSHTSPPISFPTLDTYASRFFPCLYPEAKNDKLHFVRIESCAVVVYETMGPLENAAIPTNSKQTKLQPGHSYITLRRIHQLPLNRVTAFTSGESNSIVEVYKYKDESLFSIGHALMHYLPPAPMYPLQKKLHLDIDESKQTHTALHIHRFGCGCTNCLDNLKIRVAVLAKQTKGGVGSKGWVDPIVLRAAAASLSTHSVSQDTPAASVPSPDILFSRLPARTRQISILSSQSPPIPPPPRSMVGTDQKTTRIKPVPPKPLTGNFHSDSLTVIEDILDIVFPHSATFARSLLDSYIHTILNHYPPTIFLPTPSFTMDIHVTNKNLSKSLVFGKVHEAKLFVHSLNWLRNTFQLQRLQRVCDQMVYEKSKVAQLWRKSDKTQNITKVRQSLLTEIQTQIGSSSLLSSSQHKTTLQLFAKNNEITNTGTGKNGQNVHGTNTGEEKPPTKVKDDENVRTGFVIADPMCLTVHPTSQDELTFLLFAASPSLDSLNAAILAAQKRF
ncbi:hypothetical protein BLNAU_480 [Blattamonas nauphoetae]|uniref:Uncharacterized protein n=1 Tax=Blattamonas nauphoetae TaxID=2049346 RepID=A0ABQ9YLZ2_9EUKA|nr:hypothetical protein BLNAU_480 [Blattamonas nauphoetae]